MNFIKDTFELNKATLSGQVDIIAIKQPSGSIVCSPFHIRFGKTKVAKPSKATITVTINGCATDI